MKLKRFLLRYYPPGIILEYRHRDGRRGEKELDLLHLTAEYAALRFCSLRRQRHEIKPQTIISNTILDSHDVYSHCCSSVYVFPAALAYSTDVEVLVNQIVFEEPLISVSRKGQLRRLIYRTLVLSLSLSLSLSHTHRHCAETCMVTLITLRVDSILVCICLIFLSSLPKTMMCVVDRTHREARSERTPRLLSIQNLTRAHFAAYELRV